MIPIAVSIKASINHVSIDNLKRKASVYIEDASETFNQLIGAYERHIADLEGRIADLELEKRDLMEMSRVQAQHVTDLLRQLEETKEMTP